MRACPLLATSLGRNTDASHNETVWSGVDIAQLDAGDDDGCAHTPKHLHARRSDRKGTPGGAVHPALQNAATNPSRGEEHDHTARSPQIAARRGNWPRRSQSLSPAGIVTSAVGRGFPRRSGRAGRRLESPRPDWQSKESAHSGSALVILGMFRGGCGFSVCDGDGPQQSQRARRRRRAPARR